LVGAPTLIRLLAFLALLAASGPALAQTPIPKFDYDAAKPLSPTFGAGHTLAPGIRAYAITFHSEDRIITGEVVEGVGEHWHGGLLCVHWLGDAKTTNHTEFEADAAILAQVGVTSLLIDAPWSDPHWFPALGKSADADIAFSRGEVVDLRRSLDMLEQLPNVDPDRIGVLAHDFGAMFAMMLGAVDHRPKAFVLMAPNDSLGGWYLWEKTIPDRDAYLAKLAPFQMAPYAARLAAPGGVMFQVTDHDDYVTKAQTQALYDAVPDPKFISWFHISHALDDGYGSTASDRDTWLEGRILEPPDRRFGRF
jgi:hypothetical protein